MAVTPEMATRTALEMVTALEIPKKEMVIALEIPKMEMEITTLEMAMVY